MVSISKLLVVCIVLGLSCPHCHFSLNLRRNVVWRYFQLRGRRDREEDHFADEGGGREAGQRILLYLRAHRGHDPGGRTDICCSA